MKHENPLSARSAQVLCSIVKSYIETGDPVSSSDISRLRRHNASPATIRNVMAELAERGYVEQPHASAGRVPTGAAFQVYVDTLPHQRIMQSELGRIQDELAGAESMDERVELCSHMLRQMTDGMGITAAIPSQRLDRVEFVSLGDRRVLMVVATSDGLVRNQVVSVDEAVSQDELTVVRNYVNQNFGGWVLSDVREELRRRLDRDSSAYDYILRRLILFYEKGLLDLGLTPEVHVDGASSLVSLDLRLERTILKDLFRALEEKKLVLDLLDRFLAEPGRVGAQVGLGMEPPGLRELALIGISVQMPGGSFAKVAVVGPKRMDYSRVRSAVLHVGRALGSLPS